MKVSPKQNSKEDEESDHKENPSNDLSLEKEELQEEGR